jgi:multidrug transporter EmrE-like cation transporter
MNLLLCIVPVTVLVTYSQIIVKWRTSSIGYVKPGTSGVLAMFMHFFSDPFILSAYAAAFLGSIGWLFVVSRLPLAIAFPIYIGLTFAAVICCSAMFLGEPLNGSKMLAIGLILAGIVVGSRA